MDRKTQVIAEDGKQELRIIREFDLPVALLFTAYTDAELFAQWMGTHVLNYDCVPHGSYRFETSDPQGTVVLRAHGTFHECIPETRIVRTFEIEGAPFGPQLEVMEFERLSDESSRLTMQSIYRSAEHRDRMLKLPFAYGLNMAHDRLQTILTTQKKVL